MILGIESSCDDTAIAIYDSKTQSLIAHKKQSQIIHSNYGGVVPELASRDHIKNIFPLFKSLLDSSSIDLKNLKYISYTRGPGLAGSLWVGASTASALSWILDLPLIGIHHIEGHIYSAFLPSSLPKFPFIALIVSGGHSQIIEVRDIGYYKLLGQSVDDAAGEAFDKLAKLLGLPYPGGPEIDKLSQAACEITGNCVMPRPMLKQANLNFSFSGIKTAAAVLINKNPELNKAELALEFQDAVTDCLLHRLEKSMKITNINTAIVCGGVAANSCLRAKVRKLAVDHGYNIMITKMEYCSDNAAMIAIAAYLRINANKELEIDKYAFDIQPRWSISET